MNTSAAFSFVFNIIYAIFFQEGGGDAGFIKGYKVALAANFITGLISVVLGCFGTLILKAVPPATLLAPIAGIILIGVILGWATGLNKSADVVGASKLVKWWGPVWTAGEMFDDLGIVIPIGISAAATMITQCNQSMEHIWSTLLHNLWNVFVGCGCNTSQRISRLASVADLSKNSDMEKKACEARLKAQAGRGG